MGVATCMAPATIPIVSDAASPASGSPSQRVRSGNAWGYQMPSLTAKSLSSCALACGRRSTPGAQAHARDQAPLLAMLANTQSDDTDWSSMLQIACPVPMFAPAFVRHAMSCITNSNTDVTTFCTTHTRLTTLADKQRRHRAGRCSAIEDTPGPAQSPANGAHGPFRRRSKGRHAAARRSWRGRAACCAGSAS